MGFVIEPCNVCKSVCAQKGWEFLPPRDKRAQRDYPNCDAFRNGDHVVRGISYSDHGFSRIRLKLLTKNHHGKTGQFVSTKSTIMPCAEVISIPSNLIENLKLLIRLASRDTSATASTKVPANYLSVSRKLRQEILLNLI